ncbi:uncharacterized membrane protein YhaH (DUF805 family) [Friedmanniella endophytica]|uniref:Uncharacterized membrane protein YhaH (DUF805 family) n=1 Tax=Microlunatus kandeliicorticis TaxID=1759536 RepID=A0A7W3IQP8_9ACTN|nr:M50 family metallopeptidase [Microlunatus kandeliicorticis]MBA8793464.1 uncharacterized membrane protein YhaH (DUF805 family) [Microlunatus kandeliicorticis]
MELLGEIWRRATAVQQPPPVEVVLGAALAAFVLVVVPGTWPAARMLVTIVHEGAHGFVALLAGRRLQGIRLHSDTSGLTVSKGPARGPGMVATLAAGYLGPAVVGLVAALLLAAGHALALLWLVVLVLGLMLLQIRNLFGLVVLLGAGAVMVGVSWYLSAPVQSGIAYLITWLLLIAAPKPVVELIGRRTRDRSGTSDVDQLARLTWVPGVVWAGLFLLANLAGLAVGVTVLVPSLLTGRG